MINFLKVLVRDKKVIILALFLVVQLSGCSLFFNKSEEVADWEDEVLIARKCGIEGLACCLDSEDPCEINTTCCFDPNNPGINECASKCVCGELNNFCCEDNNCGDALVCKNGRCSNCGSEGNACCAENVCDEGLLCHQENCVTCGSLNAPCCDGDNKCIISDNAEARIECIAGICQNCGRAGSSLCATEPFCDQGFFATNGFCQQCGGFNQPCCIITKVSDYSCNIEKNLSCVYGFCIETKSDK